MKFPITCRPAGQKQFERSIALLHSFAYSAAQDSFKDVAASDPQCAIAHWGIAMANFHQLWDPPLTIEQFRVGQQEIRRAQELKTPSDVEGRFIEALALIFEQALPYSTRILNYEAAMRRLAETHKNDTEAQVFYALALLAAASPLDKTHARVSEPAGQSTDAGNGSDGRRTPVVSSPVLAGELFVVKDLLC